jgi:hypothetical protein
MAAWWAGLTHAEIARAHSVSRQRIGALLAGVGCTRETSRKARRDLPDSGRRGWPSRVAEARQALAHPLAWRLTARQRGALAWQAQGLVLVDIAHRMGTTAQGASFLTLAGKERLERLAASHLRRSALPAPTRRSEVGEAAAGAGADEVGPIDVADLQAILAPAAEAAGKDVPDA